jgi:hypothetical protein
VLVGRIAHFEVAEEPDPHVLTVPGVGQRRVSVRAQPSEMNPIADALLAVMASISGDTSEAQMRLAEARRQAQTAARRHRQVVEIAALLVGGASDRAEGLAIIHTAEFPRDTELLVRMTGTCPKRVGQPAPRSIISAAPGPNDAGATGAAVDDATDVGASTERREDASDGP